MTKPVIESTEPGILSNYGFRIRQLERRPALQPGRLPWALIEWESQGSPFTATSGVQYSFAQLPNFTFGIVGAALAGVFTPNLASGLIEWHGSDTAFMGAQAVVQWNDTFVGRVVTWVFLGGGATPSGDPEFIPSISDGDLAGLRDSTIQTYVQSESNYATGYFRQDSGVDQDLFYAAVSVFRIDDADDAVGI